MERSSKSLVCPAYTLKIGGARIQICGAGGTPGRDDAEAMSKGWRKVPGGGKQNEVVRERV